MNTATYTLSEVCAAAYVTQKSYLVHAVDADGKAACKSVKSENLAGYADPKHTAPTCAKCLKAWLKV